MDQPASTTPQRRPYTGSCHCGATRYSVFLTLPQPSLANSDPPPKTAQRLYRCNCTVCHKAGFMHVRPASPTDDFLLFAPKDPFQQLGDYLCGHKKLHFFYCKTCAMRCFIFMGEGEQVDVDVAALGLAGQLPPGVGGDDGSSSTVIKAWRPKRLATPADAPYPKTYLSVNGHSIDAGQEGFDMRQWLEDKSVLFLDCLQDDKELPDRHDRPHDGGSY